MTTQEFIYKLSNPQVYTGKEINAVHKTPTENSINICLVFPDTYEIGMSHDGIKILYHMLNQIPDIIAERCFLPEKASIQVFKEHNFPLFSLETKRPLKTFDLIGFSLLTEMTYTNVLQVLALAQIPIRREQREQREQTGEHFPIIAAGGISAVNPEPLRDFIDIFAVGDGEILFPEIITVLSEVKNKTLNRDSALSLFDEVKGIYVPSLAPLEKKGRFYIPQVKTGKKRKQVSPTLRTADAIPGHKVIVPITNVVFNRLTVEIARGCPQNCRFCQAKAYYSPYRTQSLPDTVAAIKDGISETGFEDFSLSSLSSGDYPQLEELLQLIPQVITPGTSFSVPSLRPSTLSQDLLATLALFRRTGITLVPEAGSERLRRVINKNVTDEEIFKAVELALRFNWQKLKLYFMIGLPTETMEDIEAIIQLIRKIKGTASDAGKKINIHVSFSSFVPKPHTPLQWAAREDIKTLFEKIDYLRKRLQTIKFLDLDIHSPQKGLIETILTRGDYRVGDLLQKAFEAGEIFSAWDVDFHYPEWRRLMDESGTEWESFLEEIDPAEPLPWDFFEVNYNKEYLSKEYEKAGAAVLTPSCEEMECGECRGCFYGFKREKVAPKIDGQTVVVPAVPAVPAGETGKEAAAFNKIRIFYEKKGEYTFFSHLSMISYVERLIRRAGIEYKCSEGFHPRIKMASLPALPVFASGLEEVVEIFAAAGLTPGEMLMRLNQAAVASSGGFVFHKVVLSEGSRSLTKDIHFIEFAIGMPGLGQDSEKVEAVVKLLGEADAVSWVGEKLVLIMDYAHGGQERFAAIYRLIDPEKRYTVHLTRTRVIFKPPVSG
ncbi:MAG: TIGR03960 family B12-binding radical SAM protein [Candidatus Aminicenantes bacterium]|nr:TIGR03960 family B12-binding radical SAM protein [Candidatus Aminicenantes bacterium]